MMSNNTNTTTTTNTTTNMTSVYTKEEYIRLIPPVTESEYQRLKRPIKERGLLLPVVLNQDNVVLDGHHRVRSMIFQYHIIERTSPADPSTR
jgi:disulfide oxidoreductase YuzD